MRRACTGFCFFNLDEVTPKEIMHSVSGVVSFDKCVIFEIPTDKLVIKTYGYYAKPIKYTNDTNINAQILLDIFNKNSHMKLYEYCTVHYNAAFFKPIKYTENIWSQWHVNPDEQPELDWKIL